MASADIAATLVAAAGASAPWPPARIEADRAATAGVADAGLGPYPFGAGSAAGSTGSSARSEATVIARPEGVEPTGAAAPGSGTPAGTRGQVPSCHRRILPP
jgi:hypothetical protein